jgi:hypothetical protein
MEDNIKIDIQEEGWRAWTALFRHKIRTDGGLL